MVCTMVYRSRAYAQEQKQARHSLMNLEKSGLGSKASGGPFLTIILLNLYFQDLSTYYFIGNFDVTAHRKSVFL